MKGWRLCTCPGVFRAVNLNWVQEPGVTEDHKTHHFQMKPISVQSCCWSDRHLMWLVMTVPPPVNNWASLSWKNLSWLSTNLILTAYHLKIGPGPIISLVFSRVNISGILMRETENMFNVHKRVYFASSIHLVYELMQVNTCPPRRCFNKVEVLAVVQWVM